MAPTSTKSLSHFTHPPHKLTQLTTNTTYLCDGCKIAGTGARFTCAGCKFNLHDYCAKCPTWLTSTTTHPHRLSLFVHRPKPNHTQPCEICHNPIQGLAYQCKACNFLVHPVCVSSSSGLSQDDKNSSGMGSKRMDAVELAADLVYEKVAEDVDHFSYATSTASEACEVPSSGFSTGTSGGHDGGIFEAFFRSIFEGSSA